MRREYKEKENYCLKLKKEKLFKRVLQNYHIRWARALSTITRQNQSSAILKLRKYVFTKTWKVAVTALVVLKINSGFHARKNPKERYLKVVTFSDASFRKCTFMFTSVQPRYIHWTDHQGRVHERKF